MTKPTYPAEGDGVAVRLACCVPHCRRTFRNDKKGTPWPKGSITMCGTHWRTAPLEIRQRDRQLRRLLRRIDRLRGRHQLPMSRRVVRWLNENFAKGRAIVTERAMGIG